MELPQRLAELLSKCRGVSGLTALSGCSGLGPRSVAVSALVCFHTIHHTRHVQRHWISGFLAGADLQITQKAIETQYQFNSFAPLSTLAHREWIVYLSCTLLARSPRGDDGAEPLSVHLPVSFQCKHTEQWRCKEVNYASRLYLHQEQTTRLGCEDERCALGVKVHRPQRATRLEHQHRPIGKPLSGRCALRPILPHVHLRHSFNLITAILFPRSSAHSSAAPRFTIMPEVVAKMVMCMHICDQFQPSCCQPGLALLLRHMCFRILPLKVSFYRQLQERPEQSKQQRLKTETQSKINARTEG